MPTSLPPRSPPPLRPATSPPTSPQRYQHVARHQERLQRNLVSPELRRVPSAPEPLSFLQPQLPAPAPLSGPVTFNGQSFSHLPADIVTRMSNLPPIPGPSRRRRTAPLATVSTNFFSHVFIMLTFS